MCNKPPKGADIAAPRARTSEGCSGNLPGIALGGSQGMDRPHHSRSPSATWTGISGGEEDFMVWAFPKHRSLVDILHLDPSSPFSLSFLVLN